MFKGFDISAGMVRIVDPEFGVIGAGLLLSDEGLILTASHVVQSLEEQEADLPVPDTVGLRFEGEISHRVRNGQRDRPVPTREARVLADCWRPFVAADICILHYTGEFPPGVRPFPIAETRDFDRPGDELLIYGYPGPADGLRQIAATLTGEVTEYERFRAGQLESPQLRQGFSGGPVLNMDTGSIIGMASWIEDREGGITKGAFMIPASEILTVRPDLPQKKIFTQRERRRWELAGDALEILQEYVQYVASKRRKDQRRLADSNYLTVSGSIESEIHARSYRVEGKEGGQTHASVLTEDTEWNQSIEVTRLYDQFPRLHLAGMPGSGKTTSLEKIWYDNCERIDREEFAPPVPVLLSAIRYDGRKNFRQLLKEKLGLDAGEERLLEVMLDNGWIKLLIDGLNEIRRSYKDAAREEIFDLINRHPRLPVVITSRIHALDDYLIEDGVAQGIKHFIIQPLAIEDIQAYLKKTFEADKSKAERIWQRLHQTPETRELANNPMYLRMLVDVLSGEGPEGDSVLQTVGGLYHAFMQRRVADIVQRQLLPFIDSLDLDDFYRALAKIGYEVVSKISLRKKAIREIFEAQLGAVNVNSILNSLIVNKLLVKQSDRDRYTFAHPSYGEYFAAVQLRNHLREREGFPKSFTPHYQYWYESILMCAVLFEEEAHIQLLYDRLWEDRRQNAGEAWVRIPESDATPAGDRSRRITLADCPTPSVGSFPRIDTIAQFVVRCRQNWHFTSEEETTDSRPPIGERLHADAREKIRPLAYFWCKVAINYDLEIFPVEELFAAIGSLGEEVLMLEMFFQPVFVSVWSGNHHWRKQWFTHLGREKAYELLQRRQELLAQIDRTDPNTDNEALWIACLEFAQEFYREDWEENRRDEWFNALSPPPNFHELDLRSERALTSFVDNLIDPVGAYQLIMEVVFERKRHLKKRVAKKPWPDPPFSRDIRSLKIRILEHIVRHELIDLIELFDLYADLDVLQLINRDTPDIYLDIIYELPDIIEKWGKKAYFRYHPIFVKAKIDYRKAEQNAEKFDTRPLAFHFYLLRRLLALNRYISPFAQPEIDNIRALKEAVEIAKKYRYRPSGEILRSIEDLDDKDGVDFAAYEKIQSQHPGEPYTFVRLIKTLKWQKDFARIHAWLNKESLDITPENAAFVYYHRAQASDRLGWQEENIENLNLLIDNTDSFYYISRVRKYLQRKLEEGFADHPTLLYGLARARIKYKDYTGAIELLDRIDLENEHQPIALRSKGDCYALLGEPQQALVIYQQVVDWIDRHGRESYRNNYYITIKKIFRALRELEKHDEAAAVLESLLDEFNYPKLYIQCASLRAQQAAYDRAANILERGLPYTQEPVRFLARLVTYYRKAQHFDREVDTLERWLGFVAKNEIYSLAKLMQKFNEAKLYNRVIEIGSEIAEPATFPILGLLEFASAYKKMGRILPAIEIYKIVVSRQVDKSATLANIAQCYVRLERYELALEYHRRALRSDPDNALSTRHIKQIQQRLREAEPQIYQVPSVGRYFKYSFAPVLSPGQVSSIRQNLQAMSEKSFNTAILYDMNSLINCFQQDHNGAFSIREIYSEIQKIPELERVTVQLAYANWSDARLSRVNNEIAQLGVEAIQLTTSNPTFIKNQFLLNLGMDVTELIHRRPEIDYYVFISNDHNLLSLLKRLRKHGKSFLNCFYNEFANPMLRASADQFLGLESPGEATASVEATTTANPASNGKATAAFYKRYYPIPPSKTMSRDQKISKIRELLDKIANDSSMAEKIRKNGLNFHQLQEAIIYLIGEYDYIEFGCERFTDFAKILVFETSIQIFRLETENRKPILGLRDSPPPNATPEADEEDFEIHSARAYRNMLSYQTPKIILPPKPILHRIVPQIVTLGEEKRTMLEYGELISEQLEHEVEEKDIRTLLYTFHNIQILDSGPAESESEPTYWLRSAYISDEKQCLVRLQEASREKIATILQEPVSEDILHILF